MANSRHHWSRTIINDTRLPAYRIRLTRNWAASLGKLADKSELLTAIVYDLLHSMRAIEITSSLPFTLVHQFKAFVDGYVRSDGESGSERIALAISGRLARELSLDDPQLRQQIAVKCLEIGGQTHTIRQAHRVRSPFTVDDIWEHYFKDKGFRLALDESQRAGFVSAYNSYESFLVRCLSTALGQPSYRRRSPEKFSADLIAEFGDEVCGTCWDNDDIQLFRCARHSISHAGGRVTKDLTRFDHPFRVETGVIQIGPHHLMHGLRLIEKCADCIVASALAHPKFAASRRRKHRK